MEPIIDNQHTPVKVSPWKTGLKWGLISGLISIIFSLVSNYVKESPMQKSWIETLLSIALTATLITMASREHRDKDLGGYMSYGRGLGIGTITGLFGSILSAVFTFIFLSYMIDYDTMLDAEIRKNMGESAANMSDEQMEQAISMGKKFGSPGMVAVFVVFGGTFISFIISLITAAVTKRDAA